SKPSMALCRCGASKNKPFCDGTHSDIQFSSRKITDGEWDKRVNYTGKKITIHDNRGICAHIGNCTDNLPSVWRMKTEPWIDPDGAKASDIINTIHMCPSGALSYSTHNTEHRDQDRDPALQITKDGPYYVTGKVLLVEEPLADRVSTEHYALCRCGGSKNKPFCDGTHWSNEFKDEGLVLKVKKSVTKAAVKTENGYVEVGADSDFAEGEGKLVVMGKDELAVFRYNGNFSAFSHTCTHQGGPLEEGVIEDGKVVCPWHGHRFDLLTGKAVESSDENIQVHDVKVEDGKILVSEKPTSTIPEEIDLAEEDIGTPEEVKVEEKDNISEYLSKWSRNSDDFEQKFDRIQQLALGGKSEISPMRTQKTFPGLDTILFKGAQLYRMPLNEDQSVNTKTIIGRIAKHPLEIDIPFYVSHMSFGALSREAKIALAKGTSLVGTMMCSGEGGMLPEERQFADKYVYELGTARFSHVDEVIKEADAIEIKIGQAAKPGMGGHLPKEKITDEIALIRGVSPDEDSISPRRHEDINNLSDLKKEVDHLREITGGKPIGIKFSAGHIEGDIAFALKVDPDFITIDCRGGATGAAPTYIKDNVCVPAVFATRRARKYLDAHHSKVTLCITGGFRDSVDIAKALALGADAVALATTSLIAIGCQQYRICNTGKCPVGITTQNPELRKRLIVEESVKRFVNFYNATKEELENIARINGRRDVHDLDLSDIVTTSNEVSQNTAIRHV
ncbi:MAG: glutamate synthase-related protein, partial [Candidatus Electryonea clarkiae]|nr:glutamate synthase-related protein [Candidatus Electryonea clarkiae]